MKCEMLLKAYFPLISWAVTCLALRVTPQNMNCHNMVKRGLSGRHVAADGPFHCGVAQQLLSAPATRGGLM